jgi:hypothetical protein
MCKALSREASPVGCSFITISHEPELLSDLPSFKDEFTPHDSTNFTSKGKLPSWFRFAYPAAKGRSREFWINKVVRIT